MKILITGGAGYLGSVTAKALEAAGHTPIILDSLIVGPRKYAEGRIFYEGDIADRALLRRIVDEPPTSTRRSTWPRGSWCRSRWPFPTSTTATTSPSRSSSSTS